ncbi:MAG: hypothetical protein AB8B80_11310 [Marinicellaceae bacterium]
MKKTLLIGALFASGTLFAQCDISNVEGAWENVREDVDTQMDVTGPGIVGACKLTVNSTSDNGDRARLRDRSPSCESSFRASFIMNADSVGALANNQRNKVYNFQCNSNLNGGAVDCANTGIGQFRLQGDDGSNILRSFVTDEGPATVADNRRKFDVPVGAGDQTFEIHWVRASAPGAADGIFKMWHSGNTTELNPNVQFTDLQNYNYCVDQVNLGLIQPTNGWVGNHAGKDLIFDEYESRRLSGITVN